MSQFVINEETISRMNGANVESLKLTFNNDEVSSWGSQYESSSAISFHGEKLGLLTSSLNDESNRELAGHLAPILFLEKRCEKGPFALSLYEWVCEAKKIAPEVCDWIGIYYKASYFLEEETTDLYLGPYIGEYTDHQVIPLERGLCGLALREERVVNVSNVHEDQRHIACSLKTNSELIIPLTNQEGEMVAELDIDCNRLNAFDKDIEEEFKNYCLSFKDFG